MKEQNEILIYESWSDDMRVALWINKDGLSMQKGYDLRQRDILLDWCDIYCYMLTYADDEIQKEIRKGN